LNIPHSIASAYEYIDTVDLIYNEVDGTILVKPIRNAPGTKSTASVAKATTSVVAKTVEPSSSSPGSHFKIV